MTADDVTHLVGNLWTELAMEQVDLNMIYVHSPSNPADGPTRGDWSLVREIGMQIKEASFPSWCFDLWSHIVTFSSFCTV